MPLIVHTFYTKFFKNTLKEFKHGFILYLLDHYINNRVFF